MSLKRLAAKCQVCPKVDTCDHKRMESVGFLEPSMLESVSQDIQSPLLEPIARETVKIYANGKPQVVYKDEILEQLMENHYRYLGIPGAR